MGARGAIPPRPAAAVAASPALRNSLRVRAARSLGLMLSFSFPGVEGGGVDEAAAVHVARRLEAEELEDGRGYIHDRGVGPLELEAREENAGHVDRIDAVVAAPALDVVLEDGAVDDAGDAVPRRPVALVVADDEVRGVVAVGAGVNGLAVVDVGDRRRAVRAVLEGQQPAAELGLERRGFRTGSDHALRFAAGQVEVDPAETEPVGPGLRPIDILEPLGARRLAGGQGEVAVLVEPGVEVDAPPE